MFAPIDSPQRILRYVPIVLLFVRRRGTVLSVLVLTLINYLVFPLGYDTISAPSILFSAHVLQKDVAPLVLVAFVLRREGADPGSHEDL